MLLSQKTSPPPVDEFLESYVRWREACEDVQSAYRRWTQAPEEDRTLSFEIYSAALDREEHAARIHGDWAALLGAAVR